MAFPRKALDQRFAVLLLRSTYDAVDALDFIAMVLSSIILSSKLELEQKFSSAYHFVVAVDFIAMVIVCCLDAEEQSSAHHAVDALDFIGLIFCLLCHWC